MSGASDRLARSRLALIEYVHRKEVRKDRSARGLQPSPRDNESDAQPWEAAQGAAATRGGWLTRIKRAAKGYWRHHPARMGLQVATPVLSRVAHGNPVAYVAVAAVAGAVITLARPWRLVSVTGLLVALAKSPQLAGVVMSAMSASDWDDDMT